MRLAALCLMATALTACQMKKNMDEMHDATMGMAETNEKMKEGMDKTNKGMDESLEQIKLSNKQIKASNDKQDEMINDLRKGDSRNARREEISQMDESNEMIDKLESASIYFKGLEMNLWNPLVDPADRREILFKEAIEEFIRVVKGFKHNDKTNVSGLSNDKQNLYALAATMHKLNSIQEERSAAFGFATKSLYDIATEGLAALKAPKRITETPSYIEEVQRFEGEFVYMLQLRYNFLTAMAYSDAAGEPDMLEKIGNIVKIDLLKKEWVPVFANKNKAEIKYAWQKIDLAMQTRKFLVDSGYATTTDSLMVSFLSKMKWDQEAMTRGDTDPEKGVYLTKFKNTVDDYLLAASREAK